MKCERVEELLPAFLDGALAGTDATAVEAHLSTCAECRALRDALGVAGATLPSLAVPPVPSQLAQRSFTRAMQAGRAPGFLETLVWLGWRVTAVAAAGVVVAWMVVPASTTQVTSTNQPATTVASAESLGTAWDSSWTYADEALVYGAGSTR